jgi:hypothetical protein
MRTDQAPLHRLQNIGRNILGRGRNRENKKEGDSLLGSTLNNCIVHSALVAPWLSRINIGSGAEV